MNDSILTIEQMSMNLIFDLLIAFFGLGKFAVCHSSLCFFVSELYSKAKDLSPVGTFSENLGHVQCIQ